MGWRLTLSLAMVMAVIGLAFLLWASSDVDPGDIANPDYARRYHSTDNWERPSRTAIPGDLL